MEDRVKDDAADLARLKKMFEEARDLTQTARTDSLKDVDYYDGKQWTPAELAALRKRKQPDIVINRIRPAVNGILGVVERGKSEPRAYPRTPKDADSADVATDTLRYIADYTRFAQTKIRCFKDMLVPGTMAAQVKVNEDLQIEVEQIRWEEFFYDPRSRREDFRDAAYMGIARWTYVDGVKALYPDKADEIEDALNSADANVIDETFGERPSDAGHSWVDKKRRRLLVVELYYRDGPNWNRCCYIASTVLANGPSPYVDERGRPACIIEAASAYVDRENNRYGAVRDMRGPQDEVNKRRSKALHYLNTRQVQEAQPGMGMGDVNEVRTEAARPDGVIPSGWQVVPQSDQVRGQLELLQEAKNEIERLGPNPAVIGREGADASGRALMARQQAGLVELAILFGLLDDWELRIYRQMWARARQYWTGPQWVRITDDEDAPKFIGLNQPEIDPMTGQVLGYKNAIAELDIDIMLDSTPDTANLQQEQFETLVQLVGTNPMYAQQVPFELLVRLSAMRHSTDILDEIKKAREEQQAAQAQQAQVQQQAGMAKAAADIRKTNADASLSEARAQTESLKPQLEVAGMVAEAQAYPPPGSTGASPFAGA